MRFRVTLWDVVRLWVVVIVLAWCTQPAHADIPVTPEQLQREMAHAESHGEPTPAQLRALARRPFIPTRADIESDPSESVGTPSRGRLKNGVSLQDGDHYKVKAGSRTTRHGTAELVRLIHFVAYQVAEAFPRSVLTVGDLSRERGGRLRPHKSHRSGRDADIGFYLETRRGRPVHLHRFTTISRNGVGKVRGRIYKFDEARNWALIKALLSHPTIDVQHIFVANSIRRRLFAYAKKRRDDRRILARAKKVLRQPNRGPPHRSHFHVRIFCADDDLPKCKDGPPYYPWHKRRDPTGPVAKTQTAAP